ncbi:diadenosine 5',5'''-P1,P4-tetraphosphate asymmetrical hydrolase [Exidia glandulosa HHB12029]|uniref:Bis(5'-adenosyl)-triphosphatase n=1 Tax=Exidia glandulosa HHB12029 TaxID=1314781 RepID=A0A165GRD6_EXIGL|nr:diadenosine 5',5'''-P1,P4-tetraphosphate asymmetrical hydrolase [Exidia glandulosa HHB12029]
MSAVLFSTINVTTQVFYKTSLAYAIVNLKPIVRGHVLVIPTRVVPRLADLTAEEVSSLFSAVQRVGSVVQTAYGADALTVACQDGKAAGQSIPHVHVHILPRRFKGDRFENAPDDVYPELDKTARGMGRVYATKDEPVDLEPENIKVDADDARLPRTMEEMELEAKWLSKIFA